MRITIKTGNTTYEYEVRTKRLSYPDDTSPFVHTDSDWITLVSCRGFDESTGTYKWRVIVSTELIEIR